WADVSPGHGENSGEARLKYSNHFAGDRRAAAKVEARPCSLGHFTIDCPGYAESIGLPAIAECPERLLKRDGHRSLFRQRVKDPFGVDGIAETKQHGEAARPFIPLGKRIRAREHHVADTER